MEKLYGVRKHFFCEKSFKSVEIHYFTSIKFNKLVIGLIIFVVFVLNKGEGSSRDI